MSGQFYAANPGELTSQVDQFLQKASVRPSDKHIRIVIAPHAGYAYSGPVAAYGFKAASRGNYKTVVILAPSHYYGFDGIAVWPEGGFQTPLGVVPVDQELAKQLMVQDANFYSMPPAFEREHSLEVEIPFLQKTLKDFKIVPVIMGQPSFSLLEKFAGSLNKIIGDREDILIVVSTDLSHYHPDAKARAMDTLTIDMVKTLDAAGIWEGNQQRVKIEMCGFVPTVAAILYAKERGLDDIEVLRYANSGDVTGERDAVVGYTSIVIYDNPVEADPPPATVELQTQNVSSQGFFTTPEKRHLLDIARKTMEEYVRTGKVLEFQETNPRLGNEEGAFVTIHKNGQLRGCIGNIIGRGPLYKTVRDMAVAAASKDPRFDPVQPQELGEVELEISVLSRPRVVQNIDEIVLGKHGVIVSQGPWHQGIFLPQVATETGWTKEEFLRQLCAQKAGLPADAWKDPQTKIEIFTAEVFSEKDVRE
ncbi:MAG: AmmeMemoRadiSam system protein B [Candidatus Omnitrophica bacterium]|nr:AmmeMemoRadiSam system protein B [Candidatus Omnitrophota bacterium]